MGNLNSRKASLRLEWLCEFVEEHVERARGLGQENGLAYYTGELQGELEQILRFAHRVRQEPGSNKVPEMMFWGKRQKMNNNEHGKEKKIFKEGE